MLIAVRCSPLIFSDEDDTPPEENQVHRIYPKNVPGDQFIRIKLMPFFPLNFSKQLHVGGAIQLGYHRFLLSWLAVGGNVTFTYNPTIGSRVFYTIPMTASVTFQPTAWRFEFPLSLNIGMAFEAYQSFKYFPGLVLGAEAGMYFRLNENWSFGLGTTFLYLPQWYKEEPRSGYGTYDYGLFMTAEIGARYHF